MNKFKDLLLVLIAESKFPSIIFRFILDIYSASGYNTCMKTEAVSDKGNYSGLSALQTLYKDLVAYTRCFATFTKGGDLDSNTVSYLNTMACNSVGASTLE